MVNGFVIERTEAVGFGGLGSLGFRVRGLPACGRTSCNTFSRWTTVIPTVDTKQFCMAPNTLKLGNYKTTVRLK